MPPTVPNGSVVCFGVFEADLGARELRKNGVKVKIQELPFRALELLLSRPSEVLSRDEFRQALWPDGVFVDFDHGLSSAMNRLRDALGDSAENPIFIATVDRRGYRWLAPTHRPTPSPIVPPAIEGVASRPGAAPAIAISGGHVRDLAGTVPAASRRRRWIGLACLSSLVVLVLAGGFFWVRYRSAKSRNSALPGKPAFGSFVARHDPKPEARELYLKGRYYWNKRTPEDLNKAVDYFTQAIVQDPNYADPYVGLADSYNLLREYSLVPPSEAYPRALAAAKKAVELDDSSSDAHASVAFASFWGMWDAKTAELEFRRAIELSPNNAVAHHWYATYLLSEGRTRESLTEIERAQALDPSSRSVLADKGGILFSVPGRENESLALLKQMEATEPGFVSPHRYLKDAYLTKKDYPNYLIEFRKEAVLLHDKSSLAIATAAEQGFASGGEKGMLESMWQREKKLYDQGQISPFVLAETCALRGNKKEALQYLKIAYDQHADGVTLAGVESAFNVLHDEPAFRELIAGIGHVPAGQ